MKMKPKLPVSEELDFHYLLSLLPPLFEVSEFAWLPELFSVIGYESLIKLCKYAGGETIRIPTLEELTDAIDALKYFYHVELTKTCEPYLISEKIEGIVAKICEVYNAE